jgi:hypothetical protein
MPHFQLVTTDGEALGPIELDRTDWPPGSVIDRSGDQPNLRVIDVIPSDDPETFTILVVENS